MMRKVAREQEEEEDPDRGRGKAKERVAAAAVAVVEAVEKTLHMKILKEKTKFRKKMNQLKKLWLQNLKALAVFASCHPARWLS
jgi:hypothetical protein